MHRADPKIEPARRDCKRDNVVSLANWSPEEENLLFQLHAQMRNRWTSISQAMKRACYDRSENCVKNKFYSTVRKGIRKLNIYIAFKRKNTTDLKTVYKNIQPVFLSKLVAVVDGNFEEKLEVKQPAIELGIEILQLIVNISRTTHTYLPSRFGSYAQEEELLNRVQQFSKNCRRRKGKKKDSKVSEELQGDDEHFYSNPSNGREAQNSNECEQLFDGKYKHTPFIQPQIRPSEKNFQEFDRPKTMTLNSLYFKQQFPSFFQNKEQQVNFKDLPIMQDRFAMQSPQTNYEFSWMNRSEQINRFFPLSAPTPPAHDIPMAEVTTTTFAESFRSGFQLFKSFGFQNQLVSNRYENTVPEQRSNFLKTIPVISSTSQFLSPQAKGIGTFQEEDDKVRATFCTQSKKMDEGMCCKQQKDNELRSGYQENPLRKMKEGVTEDTLSLFSSENC